MHSTDWSMSGSTVFQSQDRTPTASLAWRRLPVGAEHHGAGRTHLRIWAPAAERLDVVVDDESFALGHEGNGYFSGWIDRGPGARYQLRVNEGRDLFPDPASRFQPDGPHGPSEIID